MVYSSIIESLVPFIYLKVMAMFSLKLTSAKFILTLSSRANYSAVSAMSYFRDVQIIKPLFWGGNVSFPFLPLCFSAFPLFCHFSTCTGNV